MGIASFHHDDHPQHGDDLQHLPDPVHGDPHLPAAATAVTRLQDGAGNTGTDLRYIYKYIYMLHITIMT